MLLPDEVKVSRRLPVMLHAADSRADRKRTATSKPLQWSTTALDGVECSDVTLLGLNGKVCDGEETPAAIDRRTGEHLFNKCNREQAVAQNVAVGPAQATTRGKQRFGQSSSRRVSSAATKQRCGIITISTKAPHFAFAWSRSSQDTTPAPSLPPSLSFLLPIAHSGCPTRPPSPLLQQSRSPVRRLSPQPLV
ncbi:unnamed protein product [Cercospora beticola]|nr:unnamed protein product [Cercospora beticola]